ncbi:DinB family protein [Laceyella putida]|uniref:DinB family protein n=1 Tax=Laceyella putida TaxID=110101 RepID=A0ABW2RFS1_9BACL
MVKERDIGTLCDSAINNVSRFIRAQQSEGPFVVTGYDQDEWVRAQQYQQASLEEVASLWVSLNRSVLRVVSRLPEGKETQACLLPDGKQVTLAWLIKDYVAHMEHHLAQIFAEPLL